MASLDAHAWFGLVVYFVVMALIIRGVTIRIPKAIATPLLQLSVLLRLRDLPERVLNTTSDSASFELNTLPSTEVETIESSTVNLDRSRSHASNVQTVTRVEDPLASNSRITIDLRTAPVLGVLLLLATRTIGVNALRLGIVGDNGVRPYDVLVLFISLAYISTALDATGGLRALAFLISQKASATPKFSPSGADKEASGKTLYSILYSFWFIMGTFVGNDPIVLSGTAFLASLTQITGITVPTAWIYSQFYAANIASAVLVSSNPTNVLIAGAFNLNFLTGYTKFTVLPSLITAIAAFPLTYFTFTYLKPPSRDINEPYRPSQAYIPAKLIPPDVSPRSVLIDPSGATFHSLLMTITLLLLVGLSFIEGVEVWMITAPAGILAFSRDIITEYVSPQIMKHQSTLVVTPAGRFSLPSFVDSFIHRFPTTSSTISHLPLSLLPFAGGIFILARSLTLLGWTSIFAAWLAAICLTPSITVFFLGFLITLVMCPLFGTNIGATILMVEILMDSNFQKSIHVLRNGKILEGAIFSTAVASNLGAMSWTFSSSLAGLLWVSILRQKGIIIRARDFAFWNMLFLPLLSTIASSIIILQLYYI